MSAHEFRAGFLFCGLGAGARGFLEASARLGKEGASFVNVGGVDNDPDACRDFEYLTGASALCADVATLMPEQLRALMGDEAPDAIFTSPPCKGFSGLLGKKAAEKAKYRALNNLVFQGLFLVCETWRRPPALIVLENVPRIRSRGAGLLDKVRQLLRQYGYVFTEDTHDCGEIGGLAQHRRRYLMVARLPSAVTAYVYRPPLRPVRACGAVLEQLPMPEDPGAGELHKLPKLSWLNWVRLSLIPAGGDWRDLPRASEAPDLGLKKTADGADRYAGSPGLFGVYDWNKPSNAVTGSQTVSSSNTPGAVADPRVAVNARGGRRFSDQYKVRGWKQPVGAVTGCTDIQEGAQAVADPRPAKAFDGSGALGVLDWKQPAGTVTGENYPTNGRNAVADPRVAFNGEPFGNVCKVTPWDEPAGTVTSAQSPSSGAVAVADPRFPELVSPLQDGQAKREQWARWDVRGWDQPARTVAGSGSNGGFGVADPRVELGHAPHNGTLGVQDWGEPAKAVRGRADVRTGPAAVADPRIGLPSCKPDRHHNKYRVNDWEKPVGTVIGATRPGSGAACVADPRNFALGCAPRAGVYGVLSWEQAANSVTGNARIDNGAFAVADPRKPPPFTPVIVAKDGTWHRPLTTLELAALQGLPATVNGEPLKLAGRKISAWRERIGNAVPVGAGAAIAESLLTALLAAKLGTWVLGGTGIWVRRGDGKTEAEALPEYELEAAQ